MDLFKVADYYIDKIVNTPSRKLQSITSTNKGSVIGSHIKVLLLDDVTVQTISLCTTQSKLLEHEIYLVDKLENQVNQEAMRQLRCICYLEPSDATIELLCEELQNPKYGEYQVFFNNSVEKSQLEKIASSDELECVTVVQDFFQDYFIINKHFFSLELSATQLFKTDRAHYLWKNQYELNHVADKLISVLLSLKLSPMIIHENVSGGLTKLLAETVLNKIQNVHRGLFDFQARDSKPLLFILDRYQFDPVTPLLQPWTYQSMIKEYLNIERNVVDMEATANHAVPGSDQYFEEMGDDEQDEEMKKIVLNCRQDSFFEKTMFSNFGDLSDQVKEYLNDYKKQVESKKSGMDDLQDIKKFIAEYPEFKKISFNVTKHMTLVSELDKRLKQEQIWSISELEQTLATTNATLLAEDYQTLVAMLRDESIQYKYKFKVALLYVHVYFTIQKQASKNKALQLDAHMDGFFDVLKPVLQVADINFLHYVAKQYTTKPSQDRIDGSILTGKGERVSAGGSPAGINQHAQHAQHGEDNDLFSGLARRFNQTIQMKDARPEAENVYMQHEPRLKTLLRELNGNIQKMDFQGQFRVVDSAKPQMDLPQDVVIYMVGGVTYEENRIVEEFNASIKKNNQNMRVILGGDKIYNTGQYITTLKSLYSLGNQL